MSVVVNRPSANRIVVHNVRWKTYESLLKDLENRASPRLTFDKGVLEIMSPHLEHESVNRPGLDSQESLGIWILETKGYVRRNSSLSLPMFTAKAVSELLEARRGITRPAWLRQTRKRIRELIKVHEK